MNVHGVWSHLRNGTGLYKPCYAWAHSALSKSLGDRVHCGQQVTYESIGCTPNSIEKYFASFLTSTMLLCTLDMYMYIHSYTMEKPPSWEQTVGIAAVYATDFQHYMCMYIVVTVPRQDSMSPVRANAVLAGHCNLFVGSS